MERLQKIMSRAGVASRRAAEQMILDGRVTVNGETALTLGVKADADKDRILVDGKPIERERRAYYLLYKPKGIITSAKDERGRKTVVDLLGGVPERVYPVGRLDYQTEGLLLLTNDGELTNRLIHPKYKIDKTYLAVVAGMPSETELNRLRSGIVLEDGKTAPAEVERRAVDPGRNRTDLLIVIHEGKNRQVRRMCEAVGHPVVSLKRVRFANLSLEGLRPGEFRPLSPREIDALLEAAGGKAIDNHERTGKGQ